MLVGDSITSQPGITPFWWMNGLTGGKLRMIQNAGVGSETLGGTIARIDNSYTAATPGLAGHGTLGLVFLRIGTNNVALGHSLASMQAGYDSLIASILSYAQRCVVLSVPPYASDTLPGQYNGYLSSVCAANPSRLLYIDDCVDMRTGDVQNGSYFVDGVHFNSLGTITAANAAVASSGLQSWLGNYSPFALVTDPAAVYPAQDQWVTNPTMTGTGGTKGAGFTGSLADSWSIAGVGGTPPTGVCSKVAADGADANQTTWQRVAISTFGNSSSFQVTTALSGRTISGSDPNTLDVGLELRLNSVDTLAACNWRIEVQDSSAGLLCPPSYLNSQDVGTLTQSSVIVRSAIPRDNTHSGVSATLLIYCQSLNGGAGPYGSFDFRSVGVRG